VTQLQSPLELAVEKLFPKPDPYLCDPVGWVRDEMGEVLWSKQAEMVQSVLHHRNIAVKAPHSEGKARGLSHLALWWLSMHPIGQALVVITSDNDDNIKGGIFQELIAAHEAAELAGSHFLDGSPSTQSGTRARTPRPLSPLAASRRTATRPVCKAFTASTSSASSMSVVACRLNCGRRQNRWHPTLLVPWSRPETRQTPRRTSQRYANPDRADTCSRSARTTPRRTRASRCLLMSLRTLSIPNGSRRGSRFGERRTLATSRARSTSTRWTPSRQARGDQMEDDI
jgi:hypothetical protein